MLQNLFLFVFTTETVNFDNACYMIILCTSVNDNYILHVDNMAKTNAEKQIEYRERKKLESDEFLEKERKRQKKYYVKTTQLKKKELKERIQAVKERVKRSRAQKKALTEKIREENESCALNDTNGTFTPMMVYLQFPKQGEASRKRKRRSDDRLYKKIAKLEKKKHNLKRKCDSLRKRVTRNSSTGKMNYPLTPKRKTIKMMKAAGINPGNAPEIQKQLLFAETIPKEIQEAVSEKKNKKQSIRTLVSGKILKKYRLLRYAASKTSTDRRKLSKVNGKVISTIKQKKGFEPVLNKKVLDFYNRDDVSTALPGKKDAKKVKRKRKLVQKRVLNGYLNNLYQTFMSENIEIKCSFSTFARARPSNVILANFANRKTCLCTQHQNLALKLKMLKKYKPVPTNPEAFVKYSDEKILSILESINEESFTFNIWKKVEIVNKGRKSKKIKMI